MFDLKTAQLTIEEIVGMLETAEIKANLNFGYDPKTNHTYVVEMKSATGCPFTLDVSYPKNPFKAAVDNFFQGRPVLKLHFACLIEDHDRSQIGDFVYYYEQKEAKILFKRVEEVYKNRKSRTQSPAK